MHLPEDNVLSVSQSQKWLPVITQGTICWGVQTLYNTEDMDWEKIVVLPLKIMPWLIFCVGFPGALEKM